jgi:hypothetical protein
MMSDDLNGRLYAIFREHPALLVSALYADFLIASLKEPFTWVLVVLAILMVKADNAYSMRVERKAKTRWFRWYGSPRYRFINNIGVNALVGVFIVTERVDIHPLENVHAISFQTP